MMKFVLAALAVLALTVPSVADIDHRYQNYGPSGAQQRQHQVRTVARHHRRHVTKQHRSVRHAVERRASPVQRTADAKDHTPRILPHPEGCPRRAFCGCGASIEVFGRSIRELWLAANWFRFPSASPAPGMVAVRRHHVFVIREVRSRGMVLAYDANSGGHQTRLHLRSLAGYRVVNPRGSRYANAT